MTYLEAASNHRKHMETGSASPDRGFISQLDGHGITPSMREYFLKCTEFHTYPAPGMLIGVFMVDYALDLLHKDPRDKIFVVAETEKCLPDPPQVILHATCGNHRLKILPIGKFALSFTPVSTAASAEGVRVYLDLAKLAPYPALRHWYDNKPPGAAPAPRSSIVDDILAAGRSIFSYEWIRIPVSPKKKWNSVVCTRCGDQVPDYLIEDGVCAGCGSLRYYETISAGR